VNLGGEIAPTVDLRAYLQALRKRKLAIILCLALVVGSAMVLSYRKTPLYKASSEILLKTSLQEQIAGGGQSTYVDPIRSQKTEIQIITGPDVRAEVFKRIGANRGVSVSGLPDTDILLFQAVDPRPARAAEVANTYVKSYIDLRQTQAVGELEAAATAVQARITDLGKQIDALAGNVPAPTTATTLRSAANPELEALVNQEVLQRQTLNDIKVQLTLRSGGVQIVAVATPPGAPFSPNHKRDGALAIAIGLIFGVGIALLWEFLDDTIDSKEELARLEPAVPVLAVVPPVKTWRDKSRPMLVSLTDEGSPAAEAYKSLRTSIHFTRLERQISLIQVTSPSAGEGKTSTVANLGVALARAGNRVVIVCCDLRRPRIHEFFGLQNEVGFVSVLLGESPLTAAIQTVPGVARLALLAAGPPPANPSELLSSRRAEEVFDALRKNADFVLVDCPPLLPVTDAVVLSEQVDATLLVVNAGTTTRRRLHHAADLLRQVNAPLAGMVLNGASTEGGYGYGYGYRTTPQKAARDRRKAGPNAAMGKSNGHIPVDTGQNGAANGHGATNGIAPEAGGASTGRRRRVERRGTPDS
jgi:capsular exopolysaccharide synthesis family protein